MFQKQVVSKKELRTLCGIPYSGQHIARLEAAGRFPKRIKLGQNRVAWLLTEIEAWLDERIAQREADAVVRQNYCNAAGSEGRSG
jgi:prophage regulatory protein